jgi:DNA-binding CsgD family transcriptional regulator
VADPSDRKAKRLPPGVLNDPRISLRWLPCIVSEIELDVLIGAARGESSAQTARRLMRSEQTIKTHRKRLINRMGVTNIVHAVAVAIFARWIKEEDLRRR